MMARTGDGAVPRPAAFENKICPPEELQARLRAAPRPLVFTNGVFDVLHRGHVTYLAESRAFGSSLILALNSDALESVSIVTWFETDTPLELILACRPEVLIKGGDWPVDKIVGAREVLGWGGKVHSIPFQFQRSTTALLSRIRNT
jgi:cytidyltransferase-like protein